MKKGEKHSKVAKSTKPLKKGHKAKEEVKQITKPHASKEEKAIQEGLEAIYGNVKQDFKKLDQGKGNRVTRLLVGMIWALVFILIAGAGAYFAYTQVNKTGDKDYLSIKISLEDEVISGEEITIEIDYTNPNSSPVADLEIDVNLPKNLLITELSPEPTNEEDTVWDLGTIPQFSDGTLTITGVWIGKVDTESPIQVFANFRPSNFNSEFQLIERAKLKTTGSVIETIVQTEAEANAGEGVEHTVTVTNTSETLGFENLVVAALVPDGFFIEESAPEIEAGGPIEWKIERIEPLEEVVITYTGSFAGDLEGFQYTDIVTTLEADGKRYPQSTQEAFTDVLSSSLSSLLVVNGSTSESAERLGGVLRTSISIENTGDTAVDSADLLLNFAAAKKIPIDWNRSGLDGGRITQFGLYWSASSVGIIEPGENKTYNLNLPILEELSSDYSDAFTITAETENESVTIKSTPVSILITTDAALQANIRYYDESGGQIGRGSLPPKVGEATRYVATWTISNTLHDLERVSVSAELPPYVQYIEQGNTGLGTIDYNAATRTINWDISGVPKDITSVSAQVVIEVIPQVGSEGGFLKLISSSSLQARDAKTETDIQISIGALDSELPEDSFAEGKGVVEE